MTPSGPRRTADHRAVAGPSGRRVAGARPSGDVAVVHADLSAGGASGARGDDRGHGRQPVPRLHGGDRRDQRRALASAGRGGDPQAGGPADPHVGDRLLLHAAGPAGRAAGGARAGPGAEAGLLHQQRCRGDRGRAQAGAAAHRPQPRPGVHERLPRPDLRRDVALRLEAACSAAASRRWSPRSTTPATATSRASAPCCGRSARPRSWRRSSSSRSRARGATSSRRRISCRACASSATSIGVLLVLRRGPERASAGRARCSPPSTGASPATSSAWPRGSPTACPWVRSSRGPR